HCLARPIRVWLPSVVTGVRGSSHLWDKARSCMSVSSRLRRLSLIAIPATVVAAVQSSTASAIAQGPYQQTNLVANRVGTDMPTAQHIDPHLVNPWGISAGPATPFWVSDNV